MKSRMLKPSAKIIEPTAPAVCGFCRFFFSFFGHDHLDRSFREILVHRSVGKNGLRLAALWLSLFFFCVPDLLRRSCAEKFSALMPRAIDWIKRRTAAQDGQIQPFVLIAPFRQRFGRVNDRSRPICGRQSHKPTAFASSRLPSRPGRRRSGRAPSPETTA